jgi:hypothetical protein
MLLVHVVCFGYWFKKWTGFDPSDTATKVCIVLGSGLTLLGIEVLGLGYVRALTVQAILAATVIVLLLLIPVRDKIFSNIKVCLTNLWILAHYNHFLSAACAIMFCLIVYSGLRPPIAGDELDYHLSAPFYWAQNHQWVASPFRMTNGPAFMEIIYTFSAIFGSYISAHWTHTIFLVVLMAGCAALAKRCGGHPLVSSAGVLSCPVIVNQASIAYNDVAAAALLVAGYCALFCGAHDETSGLPSRSSKIVALLLFAGAVSIKPLTLVGTLVAAIYCKQSFRPKALAMIAVYLLPFLAVLALWSVHTYHLTGRFYAYPKLSTGIARSSEDPNRTAAGRIPSLADVMTLPAVPIITGIIGQDWPYRGRTGLIIAPFCAIAIWNLRRIPPRNKVNLLWLLLAAMAYLFILGPVFILTRYNIFVWALLLCIASVGYFVANESKSDALRRLAVISYCLLTLVGMVDSAQVIMIWPRSNLLPLRMQWQIQNPVRL